MGFTGKQVIHPSQIEIVQHAFTPSAEKIKWARELIEAFDIHQQSGKGAFTFHGKHDRWKYFTVFLYVCNNMMFFLTNRQHDRYAFTSPS